MNSSDKDGNLRDATEIVKVRYGDIKKEKRIGLKLATKGRTHSLLQYFNFYIIGHYYYVDQNKKLRQWVTMSCLDIVSLELRGKRNNQQVTGFVG